MNNNYQWFRLEEDEDNNINNYIYPIKNKDNLEYNYILENFPNDFSIENVKPIDIFKLFFNNDILDYIVE